MPQLSQHEKHPWRSVTFGIIASFARSSLYEASTCLNFEDIVKTHEEFVKHIRVCSSEKMILIYFLRLSKVWSILRHR